MATNLEDVLAKKEKQLADALRKMPKAIGEEVVNFSLDNFKYEGWQGNSFQAWIKRKNPNAWGKKDDSGRALLVKTGKLKRSIRVGKTEEDKVSVIAGGADVPYARTHNEGFSGIITQHVREHYRRTRKLKEVKVKAHDRTIHQDIPKRQFIGGSRQSSQLKTQINNVIIDVLKNAFK